MRSWTRGPLEPVISSFRFARSANRAPGQCLATRVPSRRFLATSHLTATAHRNRSPQPFTATLVPQRHLLTTAVFQSADLASGDLARGIRLAPPAEIMHNDSRFTSR